MVFARQNQATREGWPYNSDFRRGTPRGCPILMPVALTIALESGAQKILPLMVLADFQFLYAIRCWKVFRHGSAQFLNGLTNLGKIPVRPVFVTGIAGALDTLKRRKVSFDQVFWGLGFHGKYSVNPAIFLCKAVWSRLAQPAQSLRPPGEYLKRSGS